jgi:sugar lactone lactonase YvrE
VGLLSTLSLVQAESLTFTTFAGQDEPYSAIDGQGNAARFCSPCGVAVDGSGNVYVADAGNGTIRKITSAGAVTTLAGTAGSFDVYSASVDGQRSSARFYDPVCATVDSNGNVYVADQHDHVIRKITSTGVVTTLAGSAGSFGYADGTGSAARFYTPRGVAVDSNGNVYVADCWNNAIRKITSAGVVTTIAGTGFNSPIGIGVDSGGNVYVADSGNHTIRKITPAGVVTTLAGTAGSPGSADGTGSAARFSGPAGVCVDSAGNVYVADGNNHTIRKITPAGVVTTLAGTAGGSGSADGTGNVARFQITYSSGVAVDGAGNVYVADTDNGTIRKITSAGVVTTLAGTARNPNCVDGTGNAAGFFDPVGVGLDSSGNMYVSDGVYTNTIRKITPAGVVTTFAGMAGSSGSTDGTGGAARFNYPIGVCVDSGGNVYVADNGNYTIRKITPTGVVTTLAGTAGSSGSADGTGSAARFGGPVGAAVDSSGNVYVTDNCTIRKITPTGVVTTLAGMAGNAGSTDGTGGAARFNYPVGVCVDSSGNVYVADSGNDTIRKITPAGVVTTLAGTAGSSGSADGTGSAALFGDPEGVAVDSGGNVYVTDNRTIRKITPAGVVTTLAGMAGNAGSANGTGSTARFYYPVGIALDSTGSVYVADEYNCNIRKGMPALDDVATIDQASGAVGAARQLNTNPKTATSWEWSIIRRPANSAAQLSSISVRNPTFTPDIGDLYTVRLTATDAAGKKSITTVDLNTSGQNLAPTANAQTVTTTESTPVSITLTGGDPEGMALSFAIASNPGHGTIAGFAASAGTLIYAPTSGYAGTDSFTFTASDGTDESAPATISITMQGSGGVGGESDSDNDGFPDEIEIALGSNPTDAQDRPFGLPKADVATGLSVVKLGIKLNFAKSGNDSISLSGLMPVPAAFQATGQRVIVDVGGVIKAFTLDAKGASPRNPAESCKLAIKAKQGVVFEQSAKFTMKLAHGSFADALKDDNLRNATTKGENVSVPLAVIFNNKLYKLVVARTYTAREGKTGMAK